MLDLDSRKLWDKDRKMVKNFQACQYFFDAILDAHLTASVASTLGIRDRYPELLAFIRSDQFDAGTLSAHITVIAERIAQSTAIKRMRELPREDRDPEFENHLMFIQHGLILRQFIHAMRHGDSGRVLASVSFFTVWFQASGKLLREWTVISCLGLGLDSLYIGSDTIANRTVLPLIYTSRTVTGGGDYKSRLF